MLVERRVPLRRVAVAAQDEALGVEALDEDVADCVERCVVAAGDDELWKRGERESVEWDLGLPGPSLGDQRAGTLLEVRRQG